MGQQGTKVIFRVICKISSMFIDFFDAVILNGLLKRIDCLLTYVGNLEKYKS